MSTPVLFRVWPKSEGGGVLALFPTHPGTHEAHTCDSYEHVGQHGAADLAGMIRRTRPATPAQYGPLKRELTRIGYKLRVVHRVTKAMHVLRVSNLRAHGSRRRTR